MSDSAWILRVVDLRRPGVTIAVNTVIFVTFLLVYLLGDTPEAEATTAVISLILAILYGVHAIALTIMLITRLLAAAHMLNPEKRFGRINFSRVIYGLFVVITMYALLQTAYLSFSPSAYNSIPPTASRGLRLRRMYFLSVETSLSLGSGAIIAAPDAEGAYLLIAINSVHAYLFNVVIVALLVAFLTFRK